MHPDFRDIKMGEMCILEWKKQNGNKVVIVSYILLLTSNFHKYYFICAFINRHLIY